MYPEIKKITEINTIIIQFKYRFISVLIQKESLKKEIEYKQKESEESIENIKKLKIELNNKNEELNKLESVLDDFHNELIQIKNNILKNNE